MEQVRSQECGYGDHQLCPGEATSGAQGGRRIKCGCMCHDRPPDPLGSKCDPRMHLYYDELHVECHWDRCECPCHFREVRSKLLELRSRVVGC